ncbi:MAG: hypothetical protein AAGF28_09070 [Pseudomonadota bacterium]
MLLRSTFVASVLVASAAFTSSSAFAQGAVDCTCIGPAASTSITSASGDVLISQGNGFVAASTGSNITTGGQVVTGADGQAVISVGPSCQVTLNPNSTASFLQAAGNQNNICLNVNETVAANTTGSGPNFSLRGLAPVVAGWIGVAIVAATDDDDDDDIGPPASP